MYDIRSFEKEYWRVILFLIVSYWFKIIGEFFFIN